MTQALIQPPLTGRPCNSLNSDVGSDSEWTLGGSGHGLLPPRKEAKADLMRHVVKFEL